MATVVLAIAAAGVLLPFSAGARVRAEGIHRTLGAKLAGDMMEEIAGTQFSQIVPSVETAGEVKDAAGAVFAGSEYERFSREVECEYVYVPQDSRVEQPRFVLVTVRVYYDGEETAVLSRLIFGG